VAKVPCPYCGRLVDRLIEGQCEECYIERHPLVLVKERRLLRCKYCGAVFLGGKWVRGKRGDLGEVARRIISEKTSIRGVLEKAEVSQSDGEIVINVVVKGSPHPSIEPRSLSYVVEFEYEYDICSTCREMLSRREVALLQIRGTPRGLDDTYKKKILNIIEQELLKFKDKKIGFISEIKYLKDGLDIYTTNSNLARHLAYVLHRQFPSSIKETAKVVGVRDGRKVYHMTYSLRLVTYKPGDVVKVRGEEKKIVDIGSRHVVLYSVETGKYDQLTISELLNSEIILIGQ
jgi:nonsense-mediated mRNA decay protein 3